MGYFKKIKEKIFKIKGNSNFDFFLLFSLSFFFIFLLIYRLNNSLHFNPYWGYDGGEHINYLLSLIKHNKIPSIAENTVAWHEPLYYFILWPIGKTITLFSENQVILLKSFSILQGLLSVAVSYFIYKIARLNKLAALPALFFTAFISFLPAMNQASTFLTNELLNYFWILVIIYYFLKYFIYNEAKRKNYIVLALISTAALLTKITALIAIGSVVIILLAKYIKKKKINWQNLTLFIFIIFLLNAPWFIYKNNFMGQGIGINNSDYLKPQAIVLDERIDFFKKFDTDVFEFPYWYSGGRGFWSMLMADSFYDYYGTMENQDYINYLTEHSIEKLKKTTHLPSYVTQYHYHLAKYQVYFALLLSIFFISSLIYIVYKTLKEKNLNYLFYSSISFGFLAAMLYFAYRYPYYDHGIVKSIFIFPFYIFPFLIIFKIISNKKYLNVLFYLFIFIYLLSLLKYYYVIDFNY